MIRKFARLALSWYCLHTSNQYDMTRLAEECNTAAGRIDTPFSFQRETAERFSNSLDSCWLEPSDFNSFRFPWVKWPDRYIAFGKSNNAVWRGKIKDVPWRHTKGHCLVYSATTRFSSLLSEIKLEISPFYLAGAPMRWLSLFSPRNLILPRVPCYLLSATHLEFLSLRDHVFDSTRKRRIRAEDRIQTEYTKLARNSRSVIKFTEHRIGHLPFVHW